MWAALITLSLVGPDAVLATTDGRDVGRRDVAPPKLTVKPYELIARLPKKTFKLGDPVELFLEFKNNTDRSVTIWNCGLFPNHRFLVRTKRGKEAQLTETGRKWRSLFGSRNRDKTYSIIVAPRRSYKYEGKPIPLELLYDLPPGHYEVVVTYSDYEKHESLCKIEASSEPIGFTVIP